MDRNTIIGFILILVILLTFWNINKPSKEKQELFRHQQDSIRIVQQEEMFKKQQMIAEKDSASIYGKVIDPALREKLNSEKYGVFSKALKDSNEFVLLENDLLKIKISAIGGRPYSVELKKYTRYNNKPVVLFNGDSTKLGFSFFSSNKLIQTNDLYFKPMTNHKAVIIKNRPDSLALRLYAGDNSYIEYVYTMSPNDYMVRFRVNFVNMGEIIANNYSSLDFNWKIDVLRQEKGVQNENQYTNLQFKYFDDDDDESLNGNSDKPVEKEVKNKVKWVAYKQQFFSSILIADNSFANASLHSVKLLDTANYLKEYNSTLGLAYENKPSFSIPLRFYFGPNHFLTLQKYNLGLEKVIFLGKSVFRWINQYCIIPLFGWLNIYFANFGLIILLLTLIIRIVLLPLTFKSYESQAKMRVLKPEIDEINKKFSKDKALEKQQATMAFYKKAGVSPLGGCLPMLLQIPILFAMFRFFPTSIELRHQHFLWATDLSTYDSVLNFPFTIPFYGNHISLFTILMTVTTVISMKMNQQTSAMDNQMPGMKTMMYIMPFTFMFILNNYSSGLTYYYLLVNLVTIGQNELFKRMINEEKLLNRIRLNKAKPVKKSKFQERLELAAKSRGMNMPKRK